MFLPNPFQLTTICSSLLEQTKDYRGGGGVVYKKGESGIIFNLTKKGLKGGAHNIKGGGRRGNISK